MADKYNLNSIPAWVISKQYGKNAGWFFLALREGTAAVIGETEKAVLVYWSCDMNCGYWAGEFWVAKSLLS